MMGSTFYKFRYDSKAGMFLMYFKYRGKEYSIISEASMYEQHLEAQKKIDEEIEHERIRYQK